ncbi:sugar ABC transporter ATP-binding protein [Anaerocolumna cellulosilytica]|uniref:Sugar ABC transporter ATP-binding protein n=1 Tax=Anaerocolumna cellulosilytica TaxID=433286 RepID=A0A6S6R2P2_9FIRM|nr:ABC transporter ATP-binding protein [Anaerocolumna cellulosilytica]MBB5196509.1 ABC-type multidrug transport system fused ATPase/permease subunit [Anaerocolumna cellulosilytica]BCJ95609.1 sugar ABC transporter ATP-binding protein [Anaerocolumna cellulosilytica]
MKKSTIKRLWGYIGRYKLQLIVVFLFALIGNTLYIFTPLLTGQAIDKIIGVGNVDFNGLVILLIKLLIIYVLSSLFQWLMSVVSSVAANNTIHDIRKDAFNKLNTLPLKYYDNHSHGDVISRLTNDIDAISDGLFQGITQVMSAVVIIAGCFIFMLTISPLITLIVVFITPLCFFIASFIAKHSRKMFAKQSQTVGELNGFVEEMIGNQKIVKAFGYEDRAYKSFKEINDRLYKAGQKAQWYSSLTNPTTRLVNNIAYVSVTIIGGFLALAAKLSIGNIASFLNYSNQFAKPINEITSITSQIQAAFASAERVFALLDEEPEIPVNVPEAELKDCQGRVSFNGVSFSYRPEVPLIKNLNLEVEKGNMVAIVGPTGSGKTTLVNLLMRFYDINGGEIKIDGTNIYQVNRDNLRQTIGMVLQESWLFSGTVADNISYGKPEATRAEIIEAAKAAKAHSFISKLPNGYDTIIDEDGGNLSQGQKQLLTIARVLIIDPPMLILDEATSSIDTRTEINIQKAFSKMMEGKTSFIIAHRLSTIKEADIILVLKNGDIIEQGSHEELLQKKGFYHTLYYSQFAV